MTPQQRRMVSEQAHQYQSLDICKDATEVEHIFLPLKTLPTKTNVPLTDSKTMIIKPFSNH